ncbi:ABC transporter ATP-binding protein [Ramlibacter sp. MAHUQ-53]|uniref:ABC transporter ATP-binding protein n=1 Tax=unclassified Ramlibacter TaxID=2617605 RepID=UPI0036348D5B
MLQIEGLHVSYGDVRALVDVHVEVPAGALIAIVGANGAGKSTLFKAISGSVPAQAGRIVFDGEDLTRVRSPSERALRGIAHVPEGRQVFSGLTVLENLEMGAQSAAARKQFGQTLEQVYALFPRLKERAAQLAGTLSGGEQQMVAIGRGLASRPKLLMLDEPSMGLAPAVADAIFERIEQIHRDNGVTVLLVEQRVGEALEACDYGYVLETGRVALEGTHEALSKNPEIKKAYLGM